MTNFKNLSIKRKLTKFLAQIADCPRCPIYCIAEPTMKDCKAIWAKWLDSEVEDE